MKDICLKTNEKLNIQRSIFSCTEDQVMFEYMVKLYEKKKKNLGERECTVEGEIKPQCRKIFNLVCSWICFLKRLNEGTSSLLNTLDLPSYVF